MKNIPLVQKIDGVKTPENVVLIHPPHPNSTDDRLDAPMGLLYIAAHMEKHGEVPVEVTDLSGVPEGEWVIPDADVYGITAYVSTLGITEQIVGECRKRNPHAKIVIGGAHASARPNDFPYADKVVTGYGEDPMLQMTGRTAPVDVFNFPAYHKVDLTSYTRRIAGKPSVTFLTTRGCPYKCSFCGLASMHHEVRSMKMMEPEVVEAQLLRIKDELGIDRINFQDDIFTMKRSRLFKILDSVKKMDIKYRCMGRAAYDNEETYARLADSGCVQIAWGIESGSQYMLDRMQKDTTVQQNMNCIKWAKKYGIVSRAFFIIGYPGETRETMLETQRFIEEADPDQYFVSNFVPYPGTETGDNPAKFGITNISSDYNQYYQVSRDGTGGITIDTEWLSRSEFRELELEFREWMLARSMRGETLDYEKKLLKGKGWVDES